VRPVFECTDGLPYVRVALNVGIETDSTFGNNRIGAIIVRIVRPPIHLTTHQSKLTCLMAQFTDLLTARYTDAVVTYDILRSYDTSMLRTLATTDLVDIYLTSMFARAPLEDVDSALGAFIGRDYAYRFFYINSMTYDDVSNITYTTNWTQFDRVRYESDFGARLMYTFE
jgi:hypothetical protein